jgi:hypothetical protein
MSNANYIDRGGEQVYQQPILADGVQFYGFVLPADANRIQERICDRYLNEPSGGQTDFGPAGPFVLLAICKLQSLSCTDAPYSDWGWFSEAETALWVLVVDRQRERMLWFHPYIFVDSSYAMAMGREIYGFPKSIGWFDIPDDHAQAETLTADTIVLPTFSPETHGTRQRLIEANRVSDEAGVPQHAWESVEEAVREAVDLYRQYRGHLVHDLRLDFNTMRDLIHRQVPMVFLKQFRDVADPAQACYQSIVEVTCKMTKFHSGWFLPGDWEVVVNRYASHPIAADLGLPDNPIRPVVSYWVSFDFEIGNGVEIWKAQ